MHLLSFVLAHPKAIQVNDMISRVTLATKKDCSIGIAYTGSLVRCEIKSVNPKGNQSWIFIGRTDADAEAPVLWCKEPTHWKRPWCWEIREGRRRGWHRTRLLDGIADSMDMSLSKFWEMVKEKSGILQSMGSQTVGHDWMNNESDTVSE